MTNDPFYAHDYFATDMLAETLHHEHVEDCLEDYENNGGTYPVTVYAWDRKAAPSEGEVAWIAGSLAETVANWWCDEWGDPEGDTDTDALKEAFREKLTAWVKERAVWSCERVAERVFDSGIGKKAE